MKAMLTIKSILSSALVALCFISAPAKAQIPTTDLANLATQLSQISAQYTDYLLQYQKYKQMLDQLKSITGVRDINTLLGLAVVKDAMSKEDYDAIMTITHESKNWFENPVNQKTLIANKNIVTKSLERVNVIKDLERKAGSTMDEKEALALNAKINAELLKVQNELLSQRALDSASLAKDKELNDKRTEEAFTHLLGGRKNFMHRDRGIRY